MRKIIIVAVIVLAILSVSFFSYYSSKKPVNIDYKIQSGKDITLFVATDIHYLAKNLRDEGRAFQKYVNSGDGKQLDYIDEIMSTFSYEIKNKKPEILIVSGDLTNNGEKESHLELAEKFKEIEANGTSVYVIPGNHDILNQRAIGFKGDNAYVADYIGSEDFSRIYGDFGYNEAVLRDKNSLSYLAAPSKDLWLLMLDTCKYKENLGRSSPQGDGEISEDTFKWIKKCSDLAKSKGAKIITVMHHNLVNHSEVLNKGYTLNNSKEAIEVFQSSGLNLVLSGHIHIQDIGSYKKDNNSIYDIATSSLSVYPNQYGVLKFTAKSETVDYTTSRLDVETWAKAVGAERKSLYDFKNNAEKFFGDLAYNKAYNELLVEDIYTKEEMELMAETFRIINLSTFSGTENLIAKDIVNSKGYKLWLNSANSSRRNYVTSIASKKDSDNNNLHIELNK